MIDSILNGYLAPRNLAVLPDRVERVLLVGGCIFDHWAPAADELSPGAKLDHVYLDHRDPDPQLGADCDFRIVQVPFRLLYHEWQTMPLGFGDEEPYSRLLDRAHATLRHFLGQIGPAAPGVPTFFLNYLAPQQNAFGRLLPRYDLRNPVFFTESVNRWLDDFARAYCNGHVLDGDGIAAVFGRRFIQDDPFWVTAHSGLIDDVDRPLDQERLEPEAPLSERYGHDPAGYVRMLWQEALAMLRTIRATDRIKMVCIDLDDTLWRGVMADAEHADVGSVEGWPLGFAEALTVLRKRGVILAIVSKNDEQFIADLMPKIYGTRLPLEAFPVRKINWRSKVDNLREAIAEANVLPDSVLFIDDNPVERQQVLQALPGIRVLGSPHLDWRRILLWSPELQVPAISDESLRRNDMIAAQVQREALRTSTSPDEFDVNLDVEAEIGVVGGTDHPRFARSLELLNKTNQFNTTGERWSREQAERHFAAGGKWTFADVTDRFTRYGLVAVAVTKDDHIAQVVMSCRIFGLGVEQALIAHLTRERPQRRLTASLVETARNGPCRTLFQKLGWERFGEEWRSGIEAPAPGRVTIRLLSEPPVMAG